MLSDRVQKLWMVYFLENFQVKIRNLTLLNKTNMYKLFGLMTQKKIIQKSSSRRFCQIASC